MRRHNSNRSDGMSLRHSNRDAWLMVEQRTTRQVDRAPRKKRPPIFWRVLEPSSFLDYAVYRESAFGGAWLAGGVGRGGSGGGMPIVFEIKIASAIAVLEMA